MALFLPEDHAANPPETWEVRKVGRTWNLTTKDGTVLGYAYPTKRRALEDRESGFYVKLYREELERYAFADLDVPFTDH